MGVLNSDKPTLGSLIRALRARHGWTLKEMSGHSGVPFSTLAKVEQGRLTLTYDKLQAMCDRLNIGMSELFSESQESSKISANSRRSIGSRETALHVSTPQYEYFYMSPELRDKDMIPIVSTIKSRTLAEFGELLRHQGEEYIYVLEGSIEVHTEFYDAIVLDQGQSVYLDSKMGHAYVLAPGHDAALILSICSSSQEELIESLAPLHGAAAPAPAKRKLSPAKAKTLVRAARD